MAPGIGHIAALEDDVIDGTLGETAARREAGMAGPDDDRGNAFDRRLSAYTF
jgi:hypothetical protein